MDLEYSNIEAMVREVLQEKLCEFAKNGYVDYEQKISQKGVISIKLPTVKVTARDLMDTGKPGDIVYTKDLFSLQQSPRLGCGVMEMKETTFNWTLNYDEIDYVIDGTLSILVSGEKVTAHAGELILIPKGSVIQFSVPEYARFIYVTYPADWENAANSASD